MNHALKPPMHRRVRIFSRSLLALCAVTLAPLDLLAEENRVTFPELEALVHYTTVRRGNVTEHISTTPEAIEAIQKGQPIPDGTHFVLADYRDTEIYRYFVMQKGPDWGKDYDENRRTGDWQYQWFWPNREVNLKENTTRCMACHTSQKSQNYLFTLSLIHI